MNDYQHPAITAIERDGTRHRPKALCQCSVCEEPIYEGESAFNFPDYGWVCEHCADRCYTTVE